MASLVWAILCQRILVDDQTNSVSYIDAVESLGASKLPATLPPILVGTLWVKERDGDEVEMRVSVLAPDGKVVHNQDSKKVVFGSEHRRYRVNLLVFGVNVAAPGIYLFSIQQRRGRGFIEVSRLPLEILTMKPDPVAAGR